MPNTPKSTLRSASIGAVLLASIASLANAQSTWDGGASTLNWGDANNWNPDGVPTSGTSVNLGTDASGLTINVGSNRDIGSGTLTFQSGAASAINLSGFYVRARNLTVQTGSGNHILGGFGLTGTGSLTVTDASQLVTITSYTSGSNANITKSGAGTLQITSWANGGVTRNTLAVNAGTLDVRSNLGLGSGSGESQMLDGSVSGVLTNGGGTTVTFSFGQRSNATSTYDGTITGNANFALGSTSTSSNRDFTGTQTLTGNNSYTGTTTVNQGTLVSSGSTSGQGDYLVRGTTSGTVTKTGAFIGTGSIGLASGSTFTVGSASHLSGSRGQLGTGTGADTIGTLSIGTLGNNNSLNFTNGSTWEVDFNNTAGDRVDVVGSVSIGATDTFLNLDSLGFTSGQSSYTLLSSTGSISGTFASVFLDGVDVTSTASTTGFDVAGTGDFYRIIYGTNDITLAAIAIPEPSAFAALAGLAGVCLAFSRRRRA